MSEAREWRKRPHRIRQKDGGWETRPGEDYAGFGVRVLPESHPQEWVAVTHLKSGWLVKALDSPEQGRAFVELIADFPEWEALQYDAAGLVKVIPPMLGPKVNQAAEEIEERFGVWVECLSCGGYGVNGHDCGEDTCVCLEPEENVECDICEGEGGWFTKPGDPAKED